LSDDPIKPRYEHDDREEPRPAKDVFARNRRSSDTPGAKVPHEYVIVSPTGEPLPDSVGALEHVAERAAQRALERVAAAHPEEIPGVSAADAIAARARHTLGDVYRANWRLYVGEFWRGDLGLTLLSISFVMEIFIITPMREVGVPGRIFFNVIVGVLMISAALTGSKSLVWKTILISSALVTGLVLMVSRMNPSSMPLHLWGSALTSVTLILYVHVVLVVMFRGGPITWSRIQGAVSAYFLVGMAFASAFEFIETRTPGSFQFMSQPVDLDQLTARMTYYSFAVLTTVGSPITTTDPWARSLTIAEAIIGQLFPTMLIGALVAMAIQGRPKPPSAS
jgi:hypothetical protein